jgi:hypothetical protein
MTADGRWDLTWRLKCSTRKCRLQPCNENYVLFSKVNLPTLLSFKYTVVPKRRTVPQYCLRAVLFSTHELRMTFLTLSSDSSPPRNIFRRSAVRTFGDLHCDRCYFLRIHALWFTENPLRLQSSGNFRFVIDWTLLAQMSYFLIATQFTSKMQFVNWPTCMMIDIFRKRFDC